MKAISDNLNQLYVDKILSNVEKPENNDDLEQIKKQMVDNNIVYERIRVITEGYIYGQYSCVRFRNN